MVWIKLTSADSSDWLAGQTETGTLSLFDLVAQKMFDSLAEIWTTLWRDQGTQQPNWMKCE